MLSVAVNQNHMASSLLSRMCNEPSSVYIGLITDIKHLTAGATTMDRGRWWLWFLLLVLGLQINQADSSLPANNTIRIGYLASYLQEGGAINVAIERAQNDSLLPGYNFR